MDKINAKVCEIQWIILALNQFNVKIKFCTMKHGIYGLLLLFLAGSFQVRAQSNLSDKVGKKVAERWVKNGPWRNGLTESPAPSVNARTFYIQYHKHPDWWEKAFAFLNKKDLATMPDGNYPIVGQDVYASISEYVPKDFDKTKFEAHRQYADIQCMIRGEEKIGEAPVSKLTLTNAYNPDKDAANYAGSGKYYIAKPGTFYIFFPGEAHRPNIKVNISDTARVKKIVIKMRVD